MNIGDRVQIVSPVSTYYGYQAVVEGITDHSIEVHIANGGRMSFPHSSVTPIPDIDRTDYEKIAADIAALVKEKQLAYGDSFGKSGNVLRQLYPDGIKPEAYDDVLTIARILDKLFRIATRKDAFSESPWNDLIGYALLAESRERRNAK